MAEKEKLFSQFPPVSTEEWRAKVDADLKGAPFEKKLVWKTNEGFNVQPMYRAEDIKDFKTTSSLPGEYPFIRGTKTNNDWLTRQEINEKEPLKANKKALEVISKGINSLGFKVADPSVATIASLLKDIDLAKIEINFSSCPTKSQELAEALVAYLKQEGKEAEFKGSIDFNPLKKALKFGVALDIEEVVKESAAILNAVKEIPHLRILSVDSILLNNAGAYIYQELGYAMSWGASYLTKLTDYGFNLDEIVARIKFNMGVSSNYFMEIAKFRAARMLWAEIVKAYNPESCGLGKMLVHAVTSRFNMTIYDAYVNLLRSQTESMSAAIAGVDSITVTPFDVTYKQPDDFSERIARNQQFLLKEESHLDKVVDPAGGSYYVETLTVSIAQEAWKLFLNIDEKGGFFESVAKGEVQKAIQETSEKRHLDVARRKEVLLGTNQYPNFNEKALDKIEVQVCCGCNPEGSNKEHSLPTTRMASDFESLRLATEASKKRPKVFMLTIGNLAMRLARAQFSSNFFGCAGYEIIDNIGFDSVEEGVKTAFEKKADVIVLCSSDDEYASLAPEAFKLIDGKAEFVVAGAPECTDELKAQGINNFIHVRCNVLDTLKEFNDRLLEK